MDMNILICDDNSDVVIQEEFVVEEAMASLKKRSSIRTFTSAKECLAAVKENKKEFSIVFLDTPLYNFINNIPDAESVVLKP